MYTSLIKNRTEEGFALLLSIIVSSVVLAIGVSLLHLSISQINLASNARESEIAYQASRAGVDCLWYWRNDLIVGNDFLSPGANPDLSCFGIPSTNGINNTHNVIPPFDGSASVSGSRIDLYSYDFEWGQIGSADRCTQVDMYIMQPGTANMTHNFSAVNEGIGDGVNKTCEVGNICTVIVSRGYNRACTVVNAATGLFTIQREITFEF